MTERSAFRERRLRGSYARTALSHVRSGLRIPLFSAPATTGNGLREQRRIGARAWLHGLLVILTCATLGVEYRRSSLIEESAPVLAKVVPESLPGALQVPVAYASAPFQALTATIPDPLAPRESRPNIVVDMMRTTHRLAPNETLGMIAEQHGISLETLIWVNGLTAGDALMVGQELQIPHLSGVVHTVAPDEQLTAIAERYAVSPAAISGFGPNRLDDDQALQAGRMLFIPAATAPLPEALLAAAGGYGQLAARTAEPAGVIRDAQTNIREGPSVEHRKLAQLDAGRQVAVIARYDDWVKIRLADTSGWVRADLLLVDPAVVAAAPERSDFPAPPPRWVWPANGTITSRYGPRWGSFHDGLDIANRAWTPILAARSGVVREAGWCRGYGYCVKIAHTGGVRTVYGHLIDRPVVRAGEEVSAGTVIGYMGSTYDRAGGGYSTGVHLHFSVFINGSAIDPLRVLP